MASLRFSSKRFRDLCAEQGVTATQLADATGCSASAVFKWRSSRARPGADALAAVAHALDVPLEAFFAPTAGTPTSNRAA
ncbi:helix-turn-helix transcriptional regulator [Lentzea sp. NPDC005914]|uniref:helix-turn-helix domain-containing protein n=1 Tax=Lentzea sp. NPDC005914 TaxID=3154572 RepID=UPI0033DF067D